MNVPLDTSDTLMKYIGALPNYICHTLFLLNPTNMDEASVQDIHIERRGKHAQDEEPSKHGEGHFNNKCMEKKTTTIRKHGENIHCTNYEKDGHG